MPDKSAEIGRQAAQAIRHELRGADDRKLERITAVLDDVRDNTAKQFILEPLRDRLATIRPARPLRFVRLLFLPLDPVIVPASGWRPDSATIPRSILTALAAVVHAALGPAVEAIERAIAGHKSDATQVITSAGEMLWPAAAEILAATPVPPGWEETGLPSQHFEPLAKAVAAVLRRAAGLRRLSRDEDVAVLGVAKHTVEDILGGMTAETAEGCALVVELILVQVPHALPLLWSCVSSAPTPAEKAMLHRAAVRATELTLTQMENESGLMNDVTRAPLANVGENVRRIATLLREIDEGTESAPHRQRMRGIREKLDTACQDRFASGLADGLVTPLTASPSQRGSVEQTELERRARDLRVLETSARHLGGAASYDRLLHQASETVCEAAKAGALTQAGKLRLVEILSGSEAAVALYRSETVPR